MKNIFSRRRRCLGLDIGESSIKMAEVALVGPEYQLRNFGQVSLPRGAVDGEFIRDPAAVTAAIRELIAKVKGTVPKVAAAIAGQSVFIRYLTLPPMSSRELPGAVTFEAEALLPVPVQDTAMDFVKIGEVKEAGITKDEIMLVAARRNTVDQLAQVIREAGLEAALIDIEPLAMLRTACVTGAGKAQGAVLMIEIGAATTTVAIFQDEVLRFTRTISFGGDKLNRILIEQFGLTVEEAETTRKLLAQEGLEDDAQPLLLQRQKTELLDTYAEGLLTEVRRSMEFYRSKNRDEEISKVLLSGGAAQMNGLADFVGMNLNLPVEMVNPVKYLTLSPELNSRSREINEAGSGLAVVIGLALSEVD